MVLFAAILIGCRNVVPLIRDIDKDNSSNMHNRQYRFYFEQYFADSIKITYGNKVIFDKYVQTVKRYAVAREYCVIDSIKKGQLVYLKIGSKHFQLKPKPDFKYYFFLSLITNLVQHIQI